MGEEDPTCSDSIPSTGINAAHLVYFGQREFTVLLTISQSSHLLTLDLAIGLIENPEVCQ